MTLKEIIDGILKEQDKPLTWLALEMDKTYAGFRLSLSNESLKYSDIKKMADVLNVPITCLFESNTQNITGSNNVQLNKSMFMEEGSVYKTSLEMLRSENEFLKQQIKDKEEIIKLLKNNK